MKTIEYSIEHNKTKDLSFFFEHPEDVLFFDIETTGFSPKGASIYLIGCAYFAGGGWRIKLFFAETPAEEREILRAFLSFARTFSYFVHFNGTTFDIPFLQAKCKKHALSPFSPQSQCDIYKRISPYKNLLHLPGCRQKQLEEYAGIYREDKFNGGQLIELYHAYCEAPDERILQVLLLHNREDLEGMTQLFSVMAVPALFENGSFCAERLSIEENTSSDSAVPLSLSALIHPEFSLPALLSVHGFSGILKKCFLAGRERSVLLRIPVYEGELKYFYPDYKNYSYLPAEDSAIHKSVAVYVDKSQRMPATAATCYTRKAGRFLPCFDTSDMPGLPLFRTDYKDKQLWVMADDILHAEPDMQKTYLKSILQALVKTKPLPKTKQDSKYAVYTAKHI